MKKPVYKYFYLILMFILLLLLDRITKSMAVTYLKDGEPFVIIKNVLEFHYLDGGNSGAAWGILKGQTAFFIVITVFVMILVALLVVRLNRLINSLYVTAAKKSINNQNEEDKSKDELSVVNVLNSAKLIKKYTVLQLIFVLLLAGAAGNLIDRAMDGSVVDFIYFKLIDFPIFNVADCYVTVSVILLIIVCIFFLKEDEFDRIFRIKRKSAFKL